MHWKGALLLSLALAGCRPLDDYSGRQPRPLEPPAGAQAEAPGAGRPLDRARLEREAEELVDAWHQAASAVDQEAYLGALADDAVFLGTAAEERWSKAEFTAYVQHYFGQGIGWTYVPMDRRLSVSADGGFAWFEERLENSKYGELRGTGALRRDGESWSLVQYSMTFTVPNGIASRVVEVIGSYVQPQEPLPAPDPAPETTGG